MLLKFVTHGRGPKANLGTFYCEDFINIHQVISESFVCKTSTDSKLQTACISPLINTFTEQLNTQYILTPISLQ